MANKATPRKRAGKTAATDGNGKAADTTKAKSKRAKAGVVNCQRDDSAPSNVTRGTVEEHASKIFTAQKVVTRISDELKTARADLSGYYKAAKNDGVNTEAIKTVGKMRKRDASEIRAEQRDVKRYLSILAPDTAKQLDMFVNWGGRISDPDAEGYAAYKNNEPISNNGYKAGSDDAAAWDAGWHRGEEQTIRGMAPGAKAAAAGGATIQ